MTVSSSMAAFEYPVQDTAVSQSGSDRRCMLEFVDICVCIHSTSRSARLRRICLRLIFHCVTKLRLAPPASAASFNCVDA